MKFKDAYKNLKVGMKVKMKDTGEIHEVVHVELSPQMNMINSPDVRIKLDNGEWTYHQKIQMV